MWSTNSCLVSVMFWQISHSILLMDVVQGLLCSLSGVIPPYWASLSWELRSFWRSREAISSFDLNVVFVVNKPLVQHLQQQTLLGHRLFYCFCETVVLDSLFLMVTLNRFDHTVWSRGQDISPFFTVETANTVGTVLVVLKSFFLWFITSLHHP